MNGTAAELELHGVAKRFPALAHPAVDQVSLKAHQGCLLALLGPSGCGKTTLLRLIAGFESPDEGEVLLDGRSVAGTGGWIPPERRGVGMVFQDFALFPHLTVQRNIAFGLPAGDTSRVREVIGLVGLEAIEHRYPHELSGGQQQRVALARALAPRPRIIVMDEPLSNLDLQLRLHLRHELRAILKAEGVTAVLVTHDQEEALSFADEVAVLREGRLEQVGPPEELYLKPATRFVAEFVTQANFLPARAAEGGYDTEAGHFPSLENAPTESAVDLMIRQEDLALDLHPSGPAVILDRHFLGRGYSYVIGTPSGLRLHARTTAATSLPPGARVRLSTAPERLRAFLR